MSSPDDKKNPLDDLAGAFGEMNMGPAWARSRDKGGKDTLKKYEKAAEREARGGGDRRDGRRGQQGARGNDRRNSRGNDRRQGGRRDDRGQRGGRPPQRPVIEVPAHISAEIMPTEAAVDVLAAQITGSGRTWSVFDQARAILEERERFHVIFQSSEKEQPLYFCAADQSVWLKRSEAVDHIAVAEWLPRYYEVRTVAVEPPKGSFTAIAKCGFSGELLGPSNFHGYQEKLRELHRTRFANMDFDRYRGRVETVPGEEVVAEWLESMSQKKIYVPREKPLTVEELSTAQSESSNDDAAPENALDTLAAVQEHFVANHFDSAFESRLKAWVPSDINARLLSPELLVALKTVIAEERKFPQKLSAFLCRQFTGRRLAAYKFRGKLKCGPSRPKAVPADANFAERPAKILDWLAANSGKSLEKLHADLVGAEASHEAKKAWDGDLMWLLREGYAILLPTLEVHLAKPAAKSSQKAQSAKPEDAKEPETQAPTEDSGNE